MIKVVWNIRDYLNEKNKLRLYHALIESKVAYSIGTWGAATKTNIDKVQKKIEYNNTNSLLQKSNRKYRRLDGRK